MRQADGLSKPYGLNLISLEIKYKKHHLDYEVDYADRT